MPTGYTACIGEGANFEEFVWNCARAFGALVLMRDDPMDAKIPLEFQPSDYHERNLKKAQQELSELQSMPEIEAAARAKVDYEKALEYREESLTKDAELAAKYNAILERVKAWEPPTPDHQEMKNFMIQQITESIKYDCGYVPPVPILQSGAEWKAARLERLARDIAYHTEKGAEEIERTKSRSEWVQQLNASVPMPKKLRA